MSLTFKGKMDKTSLLLVLQYKAYNAFFGQRCAPSVVNHINFAWTKLNKQKPLTSILM